MPNREFLAAREVVLDDGHPEKVYDFRQAKPGEVVQLITDQGVHELTRSEKATEDSDAMKEWLHDGGLVDITLFEPNKNGASFRLPGRAALEIGMEVRVNYVELSLKEANVSRSLGRAAGLADLLEMKREESDARVVVLQ